MDDTDARDRGADGPPELSSEGLAKAASKHLSARRRSAVVLFGVLVACVFVWAMFSRGLTSSNDGSHVALARALALRHETRIDDEVALTLWVDRAQRDGHDYSDRPPGTAWLAIPATLVGNLLDRPLFVRSVAAVERGASVDEALVVQPATRAYAETYGIRMQRFGRTRPVLAGLQGTVLSVTIHAITVGLVGVVLVWWALARRGVTLAGRCFATLTLAGATLWGPYSTVLFAHVTAGVLLFAYALVLEACGRPLQRTHGLESATPKLGLVLAGVGGAWAVASDYALVLAVVPIALVAVPPRRWGFILLGAVPVAAATAAYHQVAFGAPWRIGYDFHANFAFARARATTFDGDWLAGAWTLFGAGRGAGMLVQSPVTLLGLVGAALPQARARWLVLGLVPWLLVLPLHQTPWGGATLDHRYVVPILPVAALGLGAIWQRIAGIAGGRPGALVLRLVVIATALGSAVLVWS